MSDVVELLARLIAAPTHNPGGDEPALARLLAKELERRGADEVSVIEVPREGEMGAMTFARFGRPRLLLNAHIDTVPPNRGWSADPLIARLKGDRVIGLGAADTKGAIAAILCALELATPRDTAIVFSGDEERIGSCMRSFLRGGSARGLTQAIVCEPTNCKAGTRHRGIAAIEARRIGEGGHSSRADRMPAPIAELARLAVAFDDWGRARRDAGPRGFEGMCMNVAGLDGGVAFNVVPSEATLTISVRPPPGIDCQLVTNELIRLAANVVPMAQTKVLFANPSFETLEPQGFQRCLGDGFECVDLAYWTEAALLREAGIDAVVLGPGDIAQAHAPDEWVARADLDRAVSIFTNVFRATHQESNGPR